MGDGSGDQARVTAFGRDGNQIHHRDTEDTEVNDPQITQIT